MHSWISSQKWKRTLLSAGTLSLGSHANTDQAVGGLELLHGFGGVVDEGKAGGLAATELGAQTEGLDLVLLGLVEAGELLAELILGDVGAAGVQNVTSISQSKVLHFVTSRLGSGDSLPSIRFNFDMVLRQTLTAKNVNAYDGKTIIRRQFHESAIW